MTVGFKTDPVPPRGSTLCERSGKDRMTKGQAKSLAKRSRAVNKINAYECPFCGGWHVGGRRSR